VDELEEVVVAGPCLMSKRSWIGCWWLWGSAQRSFHETIDFWI